MITKNFCQLLLLLLCALSLGSCSDDEETREKYPLSFEKDRYEIPLVGQTRIAVRGGNRDYGLVVENPAILDVSVDLSSSVGMGTLVIKPKMKGETVVNVKDNLTGETVHLKIKVIDAYLAYSITESNHPALPKGTTIYLIANETKDCYFFLPTPSGETDAAPFSQGRYDFLVRLESGTGNSSPTYAIPYLTLRYACDEEGRLAAATASFPSASHSFRFELYDGVTNAEAVLPLIASYLGVDWKELVQQALKSKRVDLLPPVLKMTEDDTDYAVIGVLDATTALPENR